MEHISKPIDRVQHQIPKEVKKRVHVDHAFVGGGNRQRHMEAIAAAHGAFRRRFPTLRYRKLMVILPCIADGFLTPEMKDEIRAMGFESIEFSMRQPSYIITVEEI